MLAIMMCELCVRFMFTISMRTTLITSLIVICHGLYNVLVNAIDTAVKLQAPPPKILWWFIVILY